MSLLKTSYKILPEMPKTTPYGTSAFSARQHYIREGMFAFVSWKWVNPLSEWIGDKKCLEVMAGRGILSYALREKGVDIIATDDFSWAENRETLKKWRNPVTKVERLDAVASVEKYGADIDILIISWPYMDDTAYRVIKKLFEVNPSAVVVYIGEPRGGCTADDQFFNYFHEIIDDEFSKVVENYESWFGIYDKPVLGSYVSSNPL